MIVMVENKELLRSVQHQKASQFRLMIVVDDINRSSKLFQLRSFYLAEKNTNQDL